MGNSLLCLIFPKQSQLSQFPSLSLWMQSLQWWIDWCRPWLERLFLAASIRDVTFSPSGCFAKWVLPGRQEVGCTQLARSLFLKPWGCLDWERVCATLSFSWVELKCENMERESISCSYRIIRRLLRKIHFPPERFHVEMVQIEMHTRDELQLFRVLSNPPDETLRGSRPLVARR